MLLTTTHSYHSLQMKGPWPIASDSLLNDAELIHREEWAWPQRDPPNPPLSKEIWADSLSQIGPMVHAGLQTSQKRLKPDERITGVRVELLGTYVFRASLKYKDWNGEIYIAGNSNRVFTADLPSTEISLVTSFRRMFVKVLSVLDRSLRNEPDPRYYEAVRAGRVHISDWRCVIPEMIQMFGASVEVTSGGYQVTLLSPLDRVDGQRPLTFELTIDVLARRQLVRTAYMLGPAHRDRYPDALAANLHLCFGRIGVVKDAQEQPMFALVDIRLYDCLYVDEYIFVLRDMAGEIQRIVSSRILM